jgi:hypothetical protein
MRLVAGQLLTPLLAALLVFTTPVGTGQGVHENELLHPLLGHTHLVDGRIVSDAQLAAASAASRSDTVTSQPSAGPAFGAGSGADAPGLGLPVGPILSAGALAITAQLGGRLLVIQTTWPTEFLDQAQDPPPDPFA